MRLPEVLLFYAVIGAAVCAATWRATGERSLLPALLWPLYVPGLLAPSGARYDTAAPPPDDAVGRLRALLAAWAPELTPPLAVLDEGLRGLRARVAAIDAELARPENDLARLRAAAAAAGPNQPVHRRRLEAVLALGALRDRLRDDLAAAVAQVEGLSASVQLARFQGDDTTRVGSQLTELVAAIDGAREVDALPRSTLRP